jgi:hypothetical protein
MAIMIPDVAPDQIGHGSERDVYIALRDQLPDTYRVVHSLPWLHPDRDAIDAPLREGEADFVIFHPDYGFLVLEVKGGEELFARGQQWFRRLTEGIRRITNPFEQAKRNMHALTDAVEERTGGRITSKKYVYGYAVVFPHGRPTGTLPLDVSDQILIDVDRMHWKRHSMPFRRKSASSSALISSKCSRCFCRAFRSCAHFPRRSLPAARNFSN